MRATGSWKKFDQNHRRGEVITGPVSRITDFGLFIDLEPEVFGIVHLNDLDWNDPGIEALGKYKVGDRVDTLILSIEPERQRVVLGIKQLGNGPDHDPDSTPPEEPDPVKPKSPTPPELGSEAAKYE